MPRRRENARSEEPCSLSEPSPLAAALPRAGRETWLGQGVSLYRAAQSMMSAVATIWIPPSAMKTPAWMATARAVVRTDASSHASKASRLMPAEQRALIFLDSTTVRAKLEPYDRSCYVVNMISGTMNQRGQAPRHQRADGERTRGAILRAATALATVDGLEGLSIGNLAAAIGMSKSGLYAHFGSKQELQLATVDEAERIFDTEVVQPALAARPGVGQLAATCEAFLDYVERRVFPGGCFFAATALEMGTRPGPVRDRVAAIQSGFAAMLRGFAATAIERHELPAREDPDLLAFELHGVLLAADAKFILLDDPAVVDLARRVVHQRLGLDNDGNPGEV